MKTVFALPPGKLIEITETAIAGETTYIADCSTCHAYCCKFPGFIIRLTDEEIKSGLFDDTLLCGEFLQLPCIYLKDDRCSIYESRPKICRDYSCVGDARLFPLVDCPDCDNQGWYVSTGKDGEPEQVQCEWCYTVPNSKFNAGRR